MRLVAGLSALTLAALAGPALAAPANIPVKLAQAAPAGPPTSGWNAPAAPQARPGPPTSGWAPPTAPGAAPAPQAAPPGFSRAAPAASAPGAPAGSWSGPPSGRNCLGDLKPLLADAEERGKAIKAAAATKQQQAVCNAFKNLAAAEGKLMKYFDDHGAECGVPPEVMKARKGNYAKILEIRTKVCDASAAPVKRAPSLSDALGTSRVPTEMTPTKRGSTFDTLTGNPLAR
jgi:hypothetical protein